MPFRVEIAFSRFLFASAIAAVIAAAALTSILSAGCAAFRVPEEPPEPTPIQPVWSEAELEDHLVFLNSGQAAERTTGTQGFARAAAYVAARMREFKLQPVLEGEFRVVYSTSINYPVSGALRSVAGADSVVFFPGIDFLVDGRSDSGFVTTRTIVITNDTTGLRAAPASPFAVVLREGGADLATLTRWRDAGAVLAILVEPLTPRFFSHRIPGLVALQLAPRALLGLLPSEAASAAYGEIIHLDRRIIGLVRADFEPNAGAMNIMGYVAGKHPEHARELVLVCADLDAVSDFAGVQTLDFEKFAVGTSALLEVARNLSFVSRRWSLPERSVMLAVWSGSQLGHSGLRYFLDQPTWRLERVTSVIYVGLDPGEEEVVRELLASRGLSLDVIRPAVPRLSNTPLILVPDPALRRMARARQIGGLRPALEAADEPIVPNVDVVIDSAVVHARGMADATYGRLLLATTHPRPFYPAREDTLVIPQDRDDDSL